MLGFHIVFLVNMAKQNTVDANKGTREHLETSYRPLQDGTIHLLPLSFSGSIEEQQFRI